MNNSRKKQLRLGRRPTKRKAAVDRLGAVFGSPAQALLRQDLRIADLCRVGRTNKTMIMRLKRLARAGKPLVPDRIGIDEEAKARRMIRDYEAHKHSKQKILRIRESYARRQAPGTRPRRRGLYRHTAFSPPGSPDYGDEPWLPISPADHDAKYRWIEKRKSVRVRSSRRRSPTAQAPSLSHSVRANAVALPENPPPTSAPTPPLPDPGETASASSSPTASTPPIDPPAPKLRVPAPPISEIASRDESSACADPDLEPVPLGGAWLRRPLRWRLLGPKQVNDLLPPNERLRAWVARFPEAMSDEEVARRIELISTHHTTISWSLHPRQRAKACLHVHVLTLASGHEELYREVGSGGCFEIYSTAWHYLHYIDRRSIRDHAMAGLHFGPAAPRELSAKRIDTSHKASANPDRTPARDWLHAGPEVVNGALPLASELCWWTLAARPGMSLAEFGDITRILRRTPDILVSAVRPESPEGQPRHLLVLSRRTRKIDDLRDYLEAGPARDLRTSPWHLLCLWDDVQYHSHPEFALFFGPRMPSFQACNIPVVNTCPAATATLQAENAVHGRNHGIPAPGHQAANVPPPPQVWRPHEPSGRVSRPVRTSIVPADSGQRDHSRIHNARKGEQDHERQIADVDSNAPKSTRKCASPTFHQRRLISAAEMQRTGPSPATDAEIRETGAGRRRAPLPPGRQGVPDAERRVASGASPGGAGKGHDRSHGHPR